MYKVGISKKRYSSHFSSKIAVRLSAVEGLGHIKVLDCFHAEGELWNRMKQLVRVEELLGIEKNKLLKSTDRTIYDNNIKVLKQIDIDKYNVIDLDAFGSPFKQMEIIFDRVKSPKVIVYTLCWQRYGGVPLQVSVSKEIQEKCRTILNGYFNDMYSFYLYRHGVSEYFEIEYNKGLLKKYGYFIYNPKNDLTRETK